DGRLGRSPEGAPRANLRADLERGRRGQPRRSRHLIEAAIDDRVGVRADVDRSASERSPRSKFADRRGRVPPSRRAALAADSPPLLPLPPRPALVYSTRAPNRLGGPRQG